MFMALMNGYMPSTAQIGAWSRYLLRSSSLLDSRNRKLSGSGRNFVRDLRAWVEAVTDLLEEKNADDLIQEFIWNTSHAQLDTRIPEVGSVSGQLTSSGNTDASKALERLQLLGSLLYGSSEFRKLLYDFSVIARDIFADAASTAASNISSAAESARPSKDELENVDKPAEGGVQDDKKRSELPSKDEAQNALKELQKKGKGYAEQVRKKGYESRDEIENYLRQKFPKQRQDAIINRLKKAINDIQKDPDFNETVEFLLELMQRYIRQIKEVAVGQLEEAKDKGEIKENEAFDQSIEKGKQILVRFSNGKSLDGMTEAFKSVVNDVQNDSDLSAFYTDVVDFINRALTDKDYITSDSADHEAHRLYDRARDLFNGKPNEYRPHLDNLFDEIRAYAEAVRRDKANARVLETGKKVWSDLVVVRPNGTITFRRRVLRDVLDTILPKVVAEIRYIPIPRVEYQDKDIDLILENLVLESDNFLPRRILFEATQRAEFTNGWSFTSDYSATTKLRVNNFSLFIKDASFVLRKKTGLIPFSDRGYFDILMDGPGASAEIILESNYYSDDYDNVPEDYNEESFFSVRNVKVTIHRFSYKYHAYHSWAAAIMRPLVRPIVRKVLSSLLERKIKEGLEDLDKELYAMAERARVATIASGGQGSVENWIRAVLSRPPGAKRQARRRAKNTRDFEVTVGERELFPDEHGPGSVLTKMDAIDERIARESDGTWRSNLFDLKAR